MSIFFKGNTEFQTIPVFVSSGETTSTAVNCDGQGLIGAIMPDSLTSTSFSFLGAQDQNETFLPFYNADGNALTVICAASRIILFTPGDLIGLQFIKLVMGSAESADRTIDIITRTFM